jgi:hypothetical protein
MTNEYNILIKKLDEFIRKYYFNQIIKGLILSTSIIGLYFLIIAALEYFGHFTVVARTIIFYISIAFVSGLALHYIVIPLLKLLKIGKRIDYKKASAILGKFFPDEVGDKLQNTLELSELAKIDENSRDLIIASIAKRTQFLSPIPFVSAVKIRSNLKYARILLGVILLFVLILVLWPSVISEGTERIINYSQEFIPPPPFIIELETDSLYVRKGDDFTIKFKAVGNYAPDEMKIFFGGNSFYMQKESNRMFSYTFKNLNNSINLYAEASDVVSDKLIIEVLPAPVILDFTIDVSAPAYTGIEKRQYSNIGDISIPYGSLVKWRFNTDNISSINMLIYDTVLIKASRNNRSFEISNRMLKSTNYIVQVANEYFDDKDKISYNLNVIPDLYPAIDVETVQDSTDLALYYFSGIIDDDYGFSSLTFNCKPNPKNDSLITIPINFSRNVIAQDFYYAFDFSELESPGRISYYFEVGDNDAIAGSKFTRSKVFEYVVPSLDDIQEKTDETMENIDSKIDEAQKLTREIRDDVNKMQEKLINNEMSDWERQQSMEQISEKQERLDNILQDLSKEQKQLNDYKASTPQQKEEIIKKQQEIQELLDNLMDEEMKRLMEELQELMKEFDEEKFNELARDMEISYEDLAKQMDQNLELLKRMEVEERVQNTIDKLKKLSEEQEKLAESAKEKEKSIDEIAEEQDQLNKELEKAEEDYKKTIEKNSGLQEPLEMDDFEEEFNELQEQMEQSSEDIKDGKMNKAVKQQQQNSDKMQEMSDAMQQMMEMNMMMQMQQNMDDLRQVIENLVDFSFEQERIFSEMGEINSRNPRYQEVLAEQKKINDDFKIINDSLNAMATRMTEISGLIKDEVRLINNKMGDIMKAFEGTGTYRIKTDQQLIMTSANQLALLMSEIMEAMQMQMANQMSGNQNCKNCKNPSQGQMGQMRDMQKGMKQQMQQMIEQMKQDGGKDGKSKGQNSKDIAKMIAQQEIMQQMLNEMMNSGTLSPEAAKILNEINRMMDQNLNDLINGNITPQTINRQELILTRMLEAEKSEHEREIDEKRKSNEAKEKKISNPEKAFKEKEKELRINEMLRTTNLKFTHFYKNKYRDYLRKLNNE